MTTTVMQGTGASQAARTGGAAAAPQAQAPASPGSRAGAADQAAVAADQAAGAADRAAQALDNAQRAVDNATRNLPRDARDQLRNQLREQIRAAVQSGTQPVINIPPDFVRNAVPQGAVDISIALFVTIAACIILTPLARAFARRSDAKMRSLEETSRNLHPQLEQLQNSVDAMAIELERISEAQRFQAKLLAGKDTEPLRADR